MGCLKELKEGFTPEELKKLLDLKSDYDLKELSDQGLKAKTKGWKEGVKVVMCWTGDDSGCTRRTVHKVTDDEVQLHHLKFDPATGTAKHKDYEFTIYSLKEWK